MSATPDDDVLTTGPAARELQLSETALRQAAKLGRLPVQFTANGMRLFRRGDLVAYRTARAQRRPPVSTEGR